MADDELPPDLEDLTEQVAALSAKSEAAQSTKAQPSYELLNAGKDELAPEVAERLLLNKLAGGQPMKSKEELEKSEFLTDWGTPENEAMQKQMIDAALAAAPEVEREKKMETKEVTKEFMKGTAVKKGFLLGGSSKKEKSTAATSAAGGSSSGGSGDIVVVKPTADPKASLRLSEVQEALKASAPAMQAKLSDGKWMTPALLEKVAKEPRLVLGMQNPRYMQALNELISNPQGGMQKYANDPGLQDFLRTFMGLLGEHFSELGRQEEEQDKQRQAAQAAAAAGPGLTAVASRPVVSSSSAASSSSTKPGGILGDERFDAKELAEAAREGRLPGVDDDVREVLSQAKVVETLRDPQVQKAMEECQKDGRKLRQYLADPAMRKKFTILQKAGLIRIEL